MQKPEIVYQYRSAKARDIEAILNGQIWLSEPTEFDDPWDCALSPWLTELPSKALNIIKRLRVACFTIRNDNTRMWSHYADKHKGLCVGYSTSGISLNSWDILPVKYKTQIPKSKTLYYNDANAYKFFENLVTCKSKDWDDQEEWRYITWRKSDNIEHFDQEDLISITFGLRCDPNIKRILLKTVGFYGHVNFQEVYHEPKTLRPCIRDYVDQHG